jgi:hypothetical protein
MESLVKPQNSLKRHIKENGLVKQLTDEIKGLENYADLKGTLDLTEYVCNRVEAIINNKHKKASKRTDKQALVIKILVSVFQLGVASDITSIKDQVEYLHAHGLIKKAGITTRVGRKLLSFLGS